METPIKMDDLGVPLFLETPILVGKTNKIVNLILLAKLVCLFTSASSLGQYTIQIL